MYHQFVPLSCCNRMGAKRCSDDDEFACIHDFHANFALDEEIAIGSYAAVTYDQCWWLSVILEKNDVEHDVKVNFLHPKGPSKFCHWPQRDDVCFVPNNCILKIINVPTTTSTRRTYEISTEDHGVIIQKHQDF